jgi:hypothetical protein
MPANGILSDQGKFSGEGVGELAAVQASLQVGMYLRP